jgi:hypothetical protein
MNLSGIYIRKLKKSREISPNIEFFSGTFKSNDYKISSSSKSKIVAAVIEGLITAMIIYLIKRKCCKKNKKTRFNQN